MANLYYKYALGTEKSDIVTQVFTELVIVDKKLTSCKAKEGFEALFARHNLKPGSAGMIYLEQFYDLKTKMLKSLFYVRD